MIEGTVGLVHYILQAAMPILVRQYFEGLQGSIQAFWGSWLRV